MAKRNPIAIVVDASVARATGRQDAVYPTSIHCHQFFATFTEQEYRVVMSSEINVEWMKHQSLFATKWLAQMYGRKCVVYVGDVNDASLRKKIDRTSKIKKQQEAMMKDCHLLEAALATDQRIASLDETVRELFQHAAKTVHDIESIVWVNPDSENDDAVNWLKKGASAEKQRQLGNSDK